MQDPRAIGLKKTGMTFADTASRSSTANPSEVAGFDTSGFLFDRGATSITNNRTDQHDLSWAASLPKYSLQGLQSSLPAEYALSRTPALFGDPMIHGQANMAALHNAPSQMIGFRSPANNHAYPCSSNQTSITGVSQKMADPTSTSEDPVVDEGFSPVCPEEKKCAASIAAPNTAYAGIDDHSMSSLDMSETSGADMADWLEDVDLDTSTETDTG